MQFDLIVSHLCKNFGTFSAVDDVSFTVPEGSFFSILGPSGCGKTTLLRMIAGFEEPTSGDILISGRSMRGVTPDKRPVNLVFQHLALFPMMNVAENIAFGLKRHKVAAAEIRLRTEEILERVDLPGFGSKAIHQLSGGQKQRVAIARCLVLNPEILLLDEPLGALDLKLREQMKVELKKLQAKVGTTFMYITHDQSEALVMSDRIAVMNRGRFEQVGTPQELYRDPQTWFTASFVGDNNRWQGTIEEVNGDTAVFRTKEDFVFRTRRRPNLDRGPATLFLRPESMVIDPVVSDELNTFAITIKAILFDGGNSRLLTTTASGHELLVALPQNGTCDHLRPGAEVNLGWHPASGLVFAASEQGCAA
jgi:spermidine/putrescine transport system ATP-binding protein